MSKSRQRRKKRKAAVAKAGEVRSVLREPVPVGTEEALAAAISVDADLPAEHPLRHQAAILRDAFCAVTTGPVTPDEIRLYEVPRSSPLAPWKALVRGIAHFYRYEDDHCQRALAMIPAGSAAARLVPVLTALLDGAGYKAPNGADTLLRKKITGAGSPVLEDKAAAAEEALRSGDLQTWKDRAAALMVRTKREQPELLDALQTRILQVGLSAQMPVEVMAGNLAKPLRYDAAFWKTCARLAEGFLPPVFCLAYWDIALGDAWTERPVRLPREERAAIAIHIIHLTHSAVRQTDYYFNNDMKRFCGIYRESNVARMLGVAPPKGDALNSYLIKLSNTAQQFTRFIEEDPNEHLTDELVHWLNPTDLPCAPKSADILTELWAREQPLDPGPQLHLYRLAKARGAFTKAMRHLGAARRLGADSEEFDRSHCQLLVSRTLKRLKDR